MKKLNPPPAKTEGFSKLVLLSRPEGKHAHKDEDRYETILVAHKDEDRFKALLATAGGLHHGFREDNVLLRSAIKEEGLVVLDEDLLPW